MKKIAIVLVFFTSLFSFSHAQIKKENKWGCSIAINSIQAQVEVPLMTGSGALMVDADGNIIIGGNRVDKSFSFSIVPKYHINNDILLRLELGITKLNLQSNSDQKTATEHVKNKAKVTNNIYRYSPGLQWTFIKTNKLESYCGSSVSYISYETFNINSNYEHRDAITDTLHYWGVIEETTPGGFAIGVGAFAGFNIYFGKRISLGAELSSSELFYKLGGETVQEGLGQLLPGPVSPTNNTYANSYKGFKISKIISSFNVTVWF